MLLLNTKKWPKKGRKNNTIMSPFLAQRPKKAAALGRSPSPELKVGLRKGPYLLISIKQIKCFQPQRCQSHKHFTVSCPLKTLAVGRSDNALVDYLIVQDGEDLPGGSDAVTVTALLLQRSWPADCQLILTAGK